MEDLAGVIVFILFGILAIVRVVHMLVFVPGVMGSRNEYWAKSAI